MVSRDAGGDSSLGGLNSHRHQEEQDPRRVRHRGQDPPRPDEVAQSSKQGDAHCKTDARQRP